MAMPRHMGLGLSALALAAALTWGFMPRPVPVDIASAQRAPLRVTVEEEGRTRVIDRYVVSAPVAGYARRIELDVGDAVEQGQTLVELEPLRSEVLDPRSRATAEARVAAAQAGFQVAEQNARAAATDAEMAKKEFARRKTLAADGRISREERDRAEAAMRHTDATRRSAMFAVDVARHELEAAQTALQHSAARAHGET
ncbi:MAG: efflux transporter periplasmic adaptor subunit, partial [Gammaproteobacteria bacterium]|nr:efflux transporter periplasmic adaptor subunit [Gammaproteobacteria bacterium]